MCVPDARGTFLPGIQNKSKFCSPLPCTPHLLPHGDLPFTPLILSALMCQFYLIYDKLHLFPNMFSLLFLGG